MKTNNKTITLALLFNSAFSGAFIFIAVVMIPFWKSIADPELLQWFSNYFWRFPTIMVPLNLLTFITIGIGYFQNRKQSNTSAKLWLFALITIFLCSITYPIFFDGANKILMGDITTNSPFQEIIENWKNWHYVRTSLSIISLSFLASINRKRN